MLNPDCFILLCRMCGIRVIPFEGEQIGGNDTKAAALGRSCPGN